MKDEVFSHCAKCQKYTIGGHREALRSSLTTLRFVRDDVGLFYFNNAGNWKVVGNFQASALKVVALEFRADQDII